MIPHVDFKLPQKRGEVQDSVLINSYIYLYSLLFNVHM